MRCFIVGVPRCECSIMEKPLYSDYQKGTGLWSFVRCFIVEVPQCEVFYRKDDPEKPLCSDYQKRTGLWRLQRRTTSKSVTFDKKRLK